MHSPLKLGKSSRVDVTLSSTTQVAALPLMQNGQRPKYIIFSMLPNDYESPAIQFTNDPAEVISDPDDCYKAAGLNTHGSLLDVSGFTHVAVLDPTNSGKTISFSALENF